MLVSTPKLAMLFKKVLNKKYPYSAGYRDSSIDTPVSVYGIGRGNTSCYNARHSRNVGFTLVTYVNKFDREII